MERNEKTVVIEKTAMKTNGVLYNDKWHTVVGKAANYVKDVQNGTTYTVTEDDKGNVTFLRKEAAVSNTQTSPHTSTHAGTQASTQPAKNDTYQGTYLKAKDEKITRMNTLDKAIDWVKHYRTDLKSGQEAIIQVQLMEEYFRHFVESGDWPDYSDPVVEEDFQEGP